MSKVEFYHYTSEEGKNAILSSGVIRSSSRQGGRRDAIFGDGVYGTWLDPHNFSKKQLAMNNYDSSSRSWRAFLQQGKVDYAFKLRLPKNQVEVVQNTDRYVLLHDGDIDLDEVDFEVVRVPSSSSGVMYHASAAY